MKVGGKIGYLKLGDWWLSTFSPAERKHIEEVCEPASDGGKSRLTYGSIDYWPATALQQLVWLAGSLKKTPEDRELARRILAKAEQEIPNEPDIERVHFLYHTMIEIYYKDREDPAMLEAAIAACEKQIAIAPQVAKAMKDAYPKSALPKHHGYKQLAIILEGKNTAEALRLCQQAKSQGWDGDWDKRIENCQQRLAKASKE